MYHVRSWPLSQSWPTTLTISAPPEGTDHASSMPRASRSCSSLPHARRCALWSSLNCSSSDSASRSVSTSSMASSSHCGSSTTIEVALARSQRTISPVSCRNNASSSASASVAAAPHCIASSANSVKFTKYRVPSCSSSARRRSMRSQRSGMTSCMWGMAPAVASISRRSSATGVAMLPRPLASATRGLFSTPTIALICPANGSRASARRSSPNTPSAPGAHWCVPTSSTGASGASVCMARSQYTSRSRCVSLPGPAPTRGRQW